MFLRPSAVVAAWLESEAFLAMTATEACGRQSGTEKTCRAQAQQASRMSLIAQQLGGGVMPPGRYQRAEASSCWTLATVRGQGLPAWTFAGKFLIAATAASRLAKLP